MYGQNSYFTKFKQYLLTILFFLLPFHNSCYGAKTTDSLKAILNTHTADDTTKVNLFTKIAEAYRDANLDSVIFYSNKGLSVADKINYEKGKAVCMRQLGLAALHMNEYAKAIDYYKGALAIIEKRKERSLEALILRSIADIYYRQTNYEVAIEWYNKSMAVAQQIKDYAEEGLALINIGGIYTDQSNYPQAITYYLKGLEAFETGHDDKGISLTLVNLATVYSAIGNNKLAIDYVNKALPINAKLTAKEYAFANIVNIGVVYSNMKDYKDALAAFEKGSLLADSIGDNAWKNICLGNIADVYFHTGKYDTAFAMYADVLKAAKETHDTTTLVITQSNIGKILIKKGKWKEALPDLLECFGIARHKEMKQVISDASGSLSEVYEQLHDFPKALEYHKIYYAYHDSLNNDSAQKHMQQLQYEYELQKKESQIEISHSRNEQQRVIEWSLACGLLLLVIIIILLFRMIRFEQRNRKKTLTQKEEIQRQATKLEEMVLFKDKIFSVLSHDLRGPMGTLTTAMMLLDEYAISQEEFTQLKPDINRQISSLNNLLDNLLNWARASLQGQVEAKPEVIDLQNIIEQNVTLLRESANRKHINITVAIEGNAQAFCDVGHADIVLRNILTNAIKFTPQYGGIAITTSVAENKIALSVADTGVGMSKEQVERLFTAAPNNNTYGTDGEKGTGIGLLLCFEFIKKNNGSISVNSEPGKGTTFTIELPTRPGTK